MIALATNNPAPVTIGWSGALLALSLAHQLCDRAHRAMLDAAPGSLLDAVDAWRAAEREVERCARREEVERLRYRGVRWLGVAGV